MIHFPLKKNLKQEQLAMQTVVLLQKIPKKKETSGCFKIKTYAYTYALIISMASNTRISKLNYF